MTDPGDLFDPAPAKAGRRITAADQVQEDDAGAAEFASVRRPRHAAPSPGPLFAGLAEDRDGEIDLPKLGPGAAATAVRSEDRERDTEDA